MGTSIFPEYYLAPKSRFGNIAQLGERIRAGLEGLVVKARTLKQSFFTRETPYRVWNDVEIANYLANAAQQRAATSLQARARGEASAFAPVPIVQVTYDSIDGMVDESAARDSLRKRARGINPAPVAVNQVVYDRIGARVIQNSILNDATVMNADQRAHATYAQPTYDASIIAEVKSLYKHTEERIKDPEYGKLVFRNTTQERSLYEKQAAKMLGISVKTIRSIGKTYGFLQSRKDVLAEEIEVRRNLLLAHIYRKGEGSKELKAFATEHGYSTAALRKDIKVLLSEKAPGYQHAGLRVRDTPAQTEDLERITAAYVRAA